MKKILKEFQINLFKHLIKEGFFLSNTRMNRSFIPGSLQMVTTIEESPIFINIWAASLNPQKKQQIEYRGGSWYSKQEIRDYYFNRPQELKKLKKLTEQDFVKDLENFENDTFEKKPQFLPSDRSNAFNNFGYINYDYYIGEMKKNKELESFLMEVNSLDKVNLDILLNKTSFYKQSKFDNYLNQLPTIIEYLRQNSRDNWIKLIKNSLLCSNPSKDDYSQTINYLKDYLDNNEFLEIITNNLFYKKTNGKNILLRKAIEELVPEDSVYFNEISKKFIFLKDSKKNNQKDIGDILGEEFTTIEENKVIYKKINIEKLYKNIAVLGWSINHYANAFALLAENFNEHFKVKKVSATNVSRSNKIQEITIVHNDEKLNEDFFVDICNKFAKLLLKNKNEKNFLIGGNNNDFKEKMKVVANQFIIEKLIKDSGNNNESDNIVKKKSNKI
jgi:hypothetical protein